MKIYIYFSSYIILWSFLYYLNLIKYNPLYWLYIAIFAILIIILYLLYYETKLKLIIITFFTMIIPKIMIILLVDNKNPLYGFYFGLILFIIYLYFIDFDLYNIYYIQTTKKIMKDNYDFFTFQ